MAAVIIYTTRYILSIKPQTWRTELVELTTYDEATIQPCFKYLYYQFREEFPQYLAQIEESYLPPPPDFSLISTPKKDQQQQSLRFY